MRAATILDPRLCSLPVIPRGWGKSNHIQAENPVCRSRSYLPTVFSVTPSSFALPDAPCAPIRHPPRSALARLMEDLRALAEQLQPQLMTSGPAPKVPQIMAAILIARDGLGAREACRAVPEVPENVHGRVNKLADRVRVLLAADDYEPLLSLPAQALDQLQQVLADGGLHVVNVGGPQGVDDLMHDLGLPPLCTVPMDTEPAPEASAPEAVEPELAPEHQVVRGLGQEAGSIPPAQRASRSQHSASLVKCRTGEIRSCVERLDHGTDGVCERVGMCMYQLSGPTVLGGGAVRTCGREQWAIAPSMNLSRRCALVGSRQRW